MSSPSQPLTTTTNSSSSSSTNNSSRGGGSTNTAAAVSGGSGNSSSSNSYHTQYFYAQNAPRLMSWEEITKALERNQNSKFFSQSQQQSQQQQATYFSSLSPHQSSSSSSSSGQSGSQSIISRVDTNMYAANDPIEDRQAQEYDGPESFFAGMYMYFLSSVGRETWCGAVFFDLLCLLWAVHRKKTTGFELFAE